MSVSKIAIGLALALVLGSTLWAAGPAWNPAAHKVSQVSDPSLPSVIVPSGFPPDLARVGLEMELGELLAARPLAARDPRADREGLVHYDEPLPGARRALYMVEAKSGRLRELQLAETLPLSALASRIASARTSLGAPRAVLDCPERDGTLPTRRFVFTRGDVAVMDVYLVLRETTSVTRFVARAAELRSSLHDAQCTPMAPELSRHFPVPSALVRTAAR